MTKVWRAALIVKYKPMQERLKYLFALFFLAENVWFLQPLHSFIRLLEGTRSISKQTESIRLNKQVWCQEVTKTRRHSSKSSQMWNLKTKMCNLSSQTAIVPEKRGSFPSTNEGFRDDAGKYKPKSLTSLGKIAGSIRSLSTKIMTVCWKRAGVDSVKENPVSPICWISTTVSRSRRIKGIHWTWYIWIFIKPLTRFHTEGY